MNGDVYDDVMDDTDYLDVDDEDYGEEFEEMLDELGESDEDSSEFFRRRRKKRPKKRRVRTAAGRPAYRAPGAKGGPFVTQKQMQDALTRVGTDINRNAQGIKQVNGRLNGVVSVNAIQSREIARIDKRMKIDGALELVESFSTNADGATLDTFQLFKGAVKSGWLGEGKAMNNPILVGGIGLALRSDLLQKVVGGPGR